MESGMAFAYYLTPSNTLQVLSRLYMRFNINKCYAKAAILYCLVNPAQMGERLYTFRRDTRLFSNIFDSPLFESMDTEPKNMES